MVARHHVWAPGAILLVMLSLVIPAVKDNWNVDAISYARIAHYYQTGQFDLAVNGYFGPLLSWIAVPALWLGFDGYSATYFAMAVSAIVFVAGAIRFLRGSGTANEFFIPAGVIIALFAVYWSVAVVTPDLLASGCLLAGLATLVDDPSKDLKFRQAIGGAWFGLAVLAKSVMLPVILLAMPVVLILFIRAKLLSLKQAASRIAVLSAVMALIIVPWSILVSVHYERPVLLTSAAINHALVGPSAFHLFHPSIRTYNTNGIKH